MFVTNGAGRARVPWTMTREPGDSAAVERAVADQTDAPTEGEVVPLDVRSLGPPKPLRETLERVEALGDGDVLVQYNDRVPQFLFPRLADRGYAYAAVETDATDAVVTAVWPAESDAPGDGTRSGTAPSGSDA